MAKRKSVRDAILPQAYSAFDAKNHLGEILDRVHRGQEITITKHGVEIAKVVPIEMGRSLQVKSILKQVKELRDDIRSAGKGVPKKEILKYRILGRR